LTISVAGKAYHVEFADRAAHDLEALFLEKNAAESQAASRWCNGLEEAVFVLAAFPHRCPAAPEARRPRRKLRHLGYGKKPHIYRVIYEVDDRQKGVGGPHPARRTAEAQGFRC
jgi:toxin ParE1/3/4